MATLLPLSTLQTHGVHDLGGCIAAFTAHHGHAPGEETTFRQWAEAMPNAADMIEATRFLGAAGRRLAVRVAVNAAWRALPRFEARFPDDPRPRAALELISQDVSDPDLLQAAVDFLAALKEIESA